MKYISIILIGLILIGFSEPVFAQHHDIFILHDSLSTENGIELSQLGVWKYKAGDDPSWALPDYNDSDWLTFDSPEEIPGSLASQIGWLRYHIATDTSLKAQSYFLNIRSWGKLKVFFNGEKLGGFGPVATESDFQTTRRAKRRLDTSAPIQLTPGTQ